MFSLLTLFTLCYSTRDARVFINDMQSFTIEESNLDNYMCCALMSIVNYKYPTSEVMPKLIELYQKNGENTVAPPFSFHFIRLPLDYFFGLNHPLTDIFTDNNRCKELDIKINTTISNLQSVEAGESLYFEALQSLIYEFYKALNLNYEEKQYYFKSYVRIKKILTNSRMTMFKNTYREYTPCETCSISFANIFTSDTEVRYECEKCDDSIIFVCQSFDYNTMLTAMKLVNVHAGPIVPKKGRNQPNSQRQANKKHGTIQLKDAADVTIFVNMTSCLVKLIEIVKTMLGDGISIDHELLEEERERIVDDFSSNLKIKANMLTAVDKNRLLSLYRNTEIRLEDLNLCTVEDLAYFFLFNGRKIEESEKNNIILLLKSLNVKLMRTYCDAFLKENITFDEKYKRIDLGAEKGRCNMIIISPEINIF